ncbi:MAG TPA: AmmeMemoRadiSam system radical SAM enzyme [Candidatus Eremiobacteraeota bacterium]|nr:MAG: Pyruvate formate-lyase 1-activating enzyme [bacterium ADurb.Bin363]HPZ10350.1 AmmeMemoRadiSam system radical SAM enzyme [Candidatus Eremiobacteraeota bacterium]
MKEAMYYEKLDAGKVRCRLCPFNCFIDEGQTGVCKSRKNIDGKLYSLIYSRYTGSPFDPIEKKPLYHFYPNWKIMSLGTIGCNFACEFCQNWSSSQALAERGERILSSFTKEITPEDAVKIAKSTHKKGNAGIAYTYNEPLIGYEYVFETAKLIKKEGLKNVLVTNGYINQEPLIKLLPYIDAMNVDIKSINPAFYETLCKSKLQPVLETCKRAVKSCLIEITNLIIPTQNDSEEDIEKLTDWISENLGVDTPVHFSRYHPDYKLDIPATPPETLIKAREIAMKKLHYVYIGNIWGLEGESTYCPSCGKIVIGRSGYMITSYEMDEDKKCNFCRTKINVRGTYWKN